LCVCVFLLFALWNLLLHELCHRLWVRPFTCERGESGRGILLSEHVLGDLFKEREREVS